MLDVTQAQSQAGAVSPTKIPDRSIGLWQRACEVEWGAYGRQASVISKGVASLSWSMAWLAVLSLSVILFVQSLSRRTVTIETITVPKQLQENGFTPDVAAQRLRDTINDFMKEKKTKSLKTTMKEATIQLHGEEADIVVPAVGLSLDAILATLRRFFHDEGRQVISGDLTLDGTQVKLRLRLNREQFYNSQEGVDLGKADKLFDTAAQKIIWKIEPYLLASAAYATEPDSAFALADQIIRERVPPDENISRAYNLQALIYWNKGQYERALDVVNRALDHPANWSVAAMVHNTKGYILLGHSDKLRAQATQEFAAARNTKGSIAFRQSVRFRAEAEQEFQAAIFYDPFYVLAYINLGFVLHDLREDEAARIVYDLAKALPITNASDACTLANVLSDLGRYPEALKEFELGKKLDAALVNTSNDPSIVHCALALPNASVPSTSGAAQLTITTNAGRDPPTPNAPMATTASPGPRASE